MDLAGERVQGADGEAKTLLISRSPATDLRIQEDANPASPLRIGRLEVADDGKTALLRVALEAPTVAEGGYEWVVGYTSSAVRLVIRMAPRREKVR